MNANITSFAAAPSRHSRRHTHVVTSLARVGRALGHEARPQPLPLVLAVLPLRAVVRDGRAPRHA